MGNIVCKNLVVKKSGIVVLDDINVTIPRGEVVAIVGPNGAGKSTFVKAILGLEVVDSGKVSKYEDEKNSVESIETYGYVPQNSRSFNLMIPATVAEVLGIGQGSLPYPEIIQSLKIESLLQKRVKELSGGQIQRVLIARALINMPSILVLDEPSSALDPLIRHDLWKIMKDFHTKSNATILFVTHDVGAVGALAQKLIYLEGRMVFHGSFADFCKSPDMSGYFGPDQHLMCHQHG